MIISLSKVLCRLWVGLFSVAVFLFIQGVVLVWGCVCQCCWVSQFKQDLLLVLGCFVNVVGNCSLSKMLC